MFLKKILSLLIVVTSLISCSNDKVAVANNIEVSIDSLKAVSGQKIVMEGTSTGMDTITVAASVASAADCIVSVLEDV